MGESQNFEVKGTDIDSNIDYARISSSGQTTETDYCQFSCGTQYADKTYSWSDAGTYTVTGNVVDENGESDSVTWTVTVIAPNSAPTTPGTISSSNVTASSARVSWGASNDVDGDTITYTVEYKTDFALTWATAGITQNTYRNISGLEEDTVYDVRVRASDGTLQSSWRDQEKVITTASPKPELTPIIQPLLNISVIPGQGLIIDSRIQNTSTVESGTFKAQFYWSLDNQIDENDYAYSEIDKESIQGGSELLETETALYIPLSSVPGQEYCLLLRADTENSVDEIDESDNIYSECGIGVELKPEGVPGDSIPSDEAEQLAQRFMPKIWYDSGDKFSIPMSVENVASGTDEEISLVNIKDGYARDISRLSVNLLKDISGLDLNQDSFIILPKSSFDTLVLTPTVYFRVFYDENRHLPYAVQYWFFYYNNDWELVIDHHGDWESITIFLDQEKQPKEVAYSTHYEANRYRWETLFGSNNDTPTLYVSSGGHGSYPYSDITYYGEYVIPVFPFYIDFPDEHNGTSELTSYQLKDLHLLEGTNSWLEYEGHFGFSSENYDIDPASFNVSNGPGGIFDMLNNLTEGGEGINPGPRSPLYRKDANSERDWNNAVNKPFNPINSQNGSCTQRISGERIYGSKYKSDGDDYGPWKWANGYGLDGIPCVIVPQTAADSSSLTSSAISENTVDLSWQPTDGSELYFQVKLTDSRGHSESRWYGVLDVCEQWNSCSIEGLDISTLFPGIVQWQVKAANNGGNGAWSAVAEFEKPNAVGEAPIASNSTLTVTAGISETGNLLASDSDSSALTYAVTVEPSNGTVQITNTATGSFEYTANSDYVGVDSFSFDVFDGSTHSNEATVTITVNQEPEINVAPVALDRALSTSENTAKNGNLIATDQNADSLAYGISGYPNNGAVSLNSSTGSYTYTPQAGFSGSDSFTYWAYDGDLYSNMATVSISVEAIPVVNQPPVAASGILTTSTDVEKNGVLVATDAENEQLSFLLASQASHGLVVINDVATGQFTYTPDSGYVGTDSFTFLANDGFDDSNVATVSINVEELPVINNAPTATSTTINVQMDATFTGALNGADIDYDPLTFSILAIPSHGLLTLDDASTGSFTFVPESGYEGSDSFTFMVDDGIESSNIATVSINVGGAQTRNAGWRYPRGDLAATASDNTAYGIPANAFTESWTASQLNTIVYSTSGDIDGDGDLELVVVSGGEVRMYNADGTEAYPAISVPTTSNTRMILDDVDGDGANEILTGTRSSSSLQVNIYKPDGTAVANLSRSGGSDSHMWPVSYLGSNRLLVAYNTGYARDPRGYSVWDISTQTELWYYDLGPCMGDLSVADVDADGDMDFVGSMFTCHNGASGSGIDGTGTTTTDGDLYTILVDENGEEQLVQMLGTETTGGANGGNIHTLVDLENDGTFEIVATVGHSAPYYPGDAQLRILNLDGTVRQQVSVGTNANPRFLVSDLDNNGSKEIVVWSNVDASLSIFDNHLNKLQSQTGLGGTYFHGYVASDVDGDGIKEILVRDNEMLKVFDSADLSEKLSFLFDNRITNVWTSDLDGNNTAEIVVTTSDGSIHILSGGDEVVGVDSDGDQIEDPMDNCPAIANTSQTDTDNDGQGDACDNDDDNDGILDIDDAYPLVSITGYTDTDSDGAPDDCDQECLVKGMQADTDDDNDGVPDDEDAYPTDPERWLGVLAKNDVDGDGQSDLLWRGYQKGWNFLWTMDGTKTDIAAPINVVASQAWDMVGQGDYDGDGKSDIFWRNRNTGHNFIYLMDGHSIKTRATLNFVTAPDWEVRGSGDFNGDGKGDVIWRRVNRGDTWLYMMEGLKIGINRPSLWVTDLNFKIVGTGDFDADGDDDVLWRNIATGLNYMWLMQDAQIVNRYTLNTVHSDWVVAGTGDLDGDGVDDILLRNQVDGRNWVYLMEAGQIKTSTLISTVTSQTWQVANMGDYNGDGMSDILWREESTGRNIVHLMNGTSIINRGVLRPVDDTWKVAR